jgi:ribosome-binding protein aMBF1 (putative translation factor)
MTEIKTAGQHRAAMINKDRYSTAEELQHKRAVEAERARLETYEDLRDDVLSIIKNSGMSFEDIHGKCGPHPSTLHSWETDKVHQPRFSKMQSALRIAGYDLGIVEGRRRKDAAE